MPRAGRVAVEGGVFHVYNRIGRGVRAFEDNAIAGLFVGLLREVVERDGLTVFAWCLMPNHFHLAARTGKVNLDRPMRSLQQRVTRSVNARERVFGPMWQGRYKAKLVADQRYLDQLLVYIHLNPVTAGIVGDPAQYRWSGHREILGRVNKPVVDVDEVLRMFGTTRRSARAHYARTLKGTAEAEWIGETPGRLPWWRLGRPPKGEDEDPEEAVREERRREVEGPAWRPRMTADEFVMRGAVILGVEIDDLRSRKRAPGLVRARELLAVAGVERYRLQVRSLADAMKKSPDGMSDALARAIRRRVEDQHFRADLDELDMALGGSALDYPDC